MDWKKPVSGIAIFAYGTVVAIGDHHFLPDHFGPASATVLMPSTGSIAFELSPSHVNLTNDFEYEAAKPSNPLKKIGLIFPS